MDMKLYLLRLRVQGIKNIVEPVEINFYKKTIANNFNADKYKIKAIYGENGSGKTAIITAVKILKNIIINKSYLTDTHNQKLLFEIVNKTSKSGLIECEYLIDNKELMIIGRYCVSFEIRDDDQLYITGEQFDIKNGTYSKNQFNNIFKVKDGVLLDYNDPNASQELMASIHTKTQNLLKQRSLFTWATEDRALFKSSILYFGILFALSLTVHIDGEDDHSAFIFDRAFNEYLNDKAGITNAEKMSSIYRLLSKHTSDKLIPKTKFEQYKAYINRESRFINLFKPELNSIDIDKRHYDENYYFCNLLMNYGTYTIDSEFESRGIKKLLSLFSSLNAAASGRIVFIDELDSNINDVYLDKIIEFFKLYGEGQLCFTAHNLSPMSILKKNKNSIDFISSINTVHTWKSNGNLCPESAYKKGFIEDSPFNIDASDFLGILGGNGDE